MHKSKAISLCRKIVDKFVGLDYNIDIVVITCIILDRQKGFILCFALWEVVRVLDITDIRVKRITAEGKMKAIVSVTFDDAFVVHDIKIIEGQDKLFTAMPSRKISESEYKDIAHPINKQMRDMLEDAIIARYKQILSEEESDLK